MLLNLDPTLTYLDYLIKQKLKLIENRKMPEANKLEFFCITPEELKNYFKPEFLNRLDEIIIFNPLTKKDIEEIVELQLKRVEERLADKNIKISISAKAKSLIAEKGFDPLFGARPLKRVIQNLILNPLSLKIIEGKIKERQKVKIDVEKGKIVFK